MVKEKKILTEILPKSAPVSQELVDKLKRQQMDGKVIYEEYTNHGKPFCLKFGFDWIISLLFNERNETLWKGWFCTVISFLVKKVLKLLKSRLLDRWDIKSYN